MLLLLLLPSSAYGSDSLLLLISFFQSRPFLGDRRKFHQLADPFLQGRYPPRPFHQLVVIASMCLQEQPHVRPIIADVVVALNHVASQPYTLAPDSKIMSSPPPPSPSGRVTGTPSRGRNGKTLARI